MCRILALVAAPTTEPTNWAAHGPLRSIGALGLISIVALGCRSGSAVRPPSDADERPSGCIDTPFLGPTESIAARGVTCGRQRSDAVQLVHGRVVEAAAGGLPGPAIEGVWVRVRGAPSGDARTDAQGRFSLRVPVAWSAVPVVEVRRDRYGPVVAAKPVPNAVDGAPPDVLIRLEP